MARLIRPEEFGAGEDIGDVIREINNKIDDNANALRRAARAMQDMEEDLYKLIHRNAVEITNLRLRTAHLNIPNAPVEQGGGKTRRKKKQRRRRTRKRKRVKRRRRTRRR